MQSSASAFSLGQRIPLGKRQPRVLNALSQRVCSMGLVAADVASFSTAAVCGQLLASLGHRLNPWQHLDNVSEYGAGWHGWSVIAIFVGVVVYRGMVGDYTSRMPFWMQARHVVMASLCALACDCMLSNAIYGVPFNLEPMLRWVMFAPFALIGRAAAGAALSKAGHWTLNTLVIGHDNLSEKIIGALKHEPSLGYRIAGQLSFDDVAGLTTPGDWLGFAQSRSAHMVMIAGRDGVSMESGALMALERSGLPFSYVEGGNGLPIGQRRSHYFLTHDVKFSVIQRSAFHPVRHAVKRAFDFSVAFTLMMFILPVFMVLAALIRLDGGPAIFRQKRIGRNGEIFHCMKFRSMRTDAAEVLAQLLATDPAIAEEWNATQKLQNDVRITKVGHFLRKTSLDELPQLLNVLRGEMSLVGPRPIVNAEVEKYGDHICYYHDVRPGVTGLWQVSGRSSTSYERRVNLDVWYVKNWSLWHDMVIMLKTIPAVLLRDGAV